MKKPEKKPLGRPPKEWTYNYLDLARVTGQSYEAVKQHFKRGRFDPAKLEDIIRYVLRYCRNEDLRRSAVDWALQLQEPGGKMRRQPKS